MQKAASYSCGERLNIGFEKGSENATSEGSLGFSEKLQSAF